MGRPKLRWSDVTRKYMKEKQVKKERRTWRWKLDEPTPNREKAEKKSESHFQVIPWLNNKATFLFIGQVKVLHPSLSPTPPSAAIDLSPPDDFYNVPYISLLSKRFNFSKSYV